MQKSSAQAVCKLPAAAQPAALAAHHPRWAAQAVGKAFQLRA
jgi:hypothetical protein